jgi:NAD(P)H-hydrate epimerase
VVAVDCPSGIDCDSGEAAPETIPAIVTATMAAIKDGLLKFPAYEFLGDLHLVGIGLPNNGEDLHAWRSVQCFIPESNWIQKNLPPRPLNSHKGSFGTSLIVSGSTNYTGATLLSGLAAHRIGTGLVTSAIPASIHPAVAG